MNMHSATREPAMETDPLMVQSPDDGASTDDEEAMHLLKNGGGDDDVGGDSTITESVLKVVLQLGDNFNYYGEVVYELDQENDSGTIRTTSDEDTFCELPLGNDSNGSTGTISDVDTFFALPLESESIVQEFHEVTEALFEELEGADKGEQYSYMLEMGLTRNMSITPADIQGAAKAAAKLDGDVGEGAPLSAYLLLITAVIGLSSIGPLLNMQPGVNALVKVFWRASATSMALFPFAFNSLSNEGLPKLTRLQWCVFFLTATSYTITTAGYVLALDYTTVGNATIISNTQALILLAAKLFTGNTILPTEAIGAIFAFAGATLCSMDARGGGSSLDGSGGGNTSLGDLYAFVSALGGASYLVLAKSLRPHTNLFVFMFFIMSVGSLNMLLFMVVSNTEFTLDFHADHGLLGWMNLRGDRLPVEASMVITCNIVGVLGYARAMQYFDNLVISVAALMEPVIAEVMAFLLGVGSLPGTLGWAGNLMVAGGTFAVVLPVASKKK
jgi:drug/metabolite transporter (DMT)-like permease